MTVCNRSIDVLWGTYGANVVHMSILQEYIANRVGVPVGPYYQISDSYHVYITGPGGDLWLKMMDSGPMLDYYASGLAMPVPLGAGDALWDVDLHDFFRYWDAGIDPGAQSYKTEWWNGVARPMWAGWKLRSIGPLKYCLATDWKIAGLEWLTRREHL